MLCEHIDVKADIKYTELKICFLQIISWPIHALFNNCWLRENFENYSYNVASVHS